MKKYLLIVLISFALVSMVAFIFLKNDASKKSVISQSEEGLVASCEKTGGAWKEESDPCRPTCNYQRGTLKGEKISCMTVIVPNCECEKDKCWNGSSCEPLLENQAPAPIAETQKTFKGSGFSFTHPANYTADSRGLWTAEGYQRHINPPAVCDTCQIPEIEVIATTSSNTIDQQIISDYALPGKTLAEMSKQTGLKYENIKIGNNDFIKITVNEMFSLTEYYTKHNNQIVAFKVYFDEKDNEVLKNIISTIRFE